ncbi:MAG: cation transporter [Magnetococcales bacterium]|nr:cation transporter [Magnetococcales bacterium]
MNHHHHHHHGHDHDDDDHDLPAELKQERYNASKRVTLLGAFVNIFLTAGKLFAGIFGGSAAMIADGIHSASDLVSDVVVLFSIKMAHKEADEDHPYGHGKFEALATLFVAVALLTVALGIVWESVGRLMEPNLEPPTMVALIAAIVSIVSKEAMFQYTIRVGRKYDAKAIIANAWHQRSDAISSVAAMVGVGGAMYGWTILDPLAAVAVAFFLGKVGVEVLMDALKELTDSIEAIDEEVRKEIHEVAHDLPGVRSIHAMHARRMGPDVYVDAHVVVDRYLSVSEGHQIADMVRFKLRDHVRSVTEVMVHVDTEDDHIEDNIVPIYPSRTEFRAVVEKVVSEFATFTGIHDVTPHFCPKGVQLSVNLEVADDCTLAEARSQSEALSEQLKQAHDTIREVQCSLHLIDQRA